MRTFKLLSERKGLLDIVRHAEDIETLIDA